MVKEVRYFMNSVGEAIVYDEGERGYAIEQRIKKGPGVYNCRLWDASDIDMATKRFNRVKGTLRAMQTRRINGK